MGRQVLPDRDSEFGRRVRGRLRDERIAWLTTVGRDGTPQPNPVWFVWDDTPNVLVYNRADAQRLTHIAQRPRVALHFNSGADGNDIIVLTWDAAVRSDMPAPHQHRGYLAKYEDAMTGVSGSPEAFSEDYSVPVVIQLNRVRGF